MSEKSPIHQKQCDDYRDEIYSDIKEIRNEVSSMKGAHRLAVIISPIIVSVILTLGGLAFASYIKSELLTLKIELMEQKESETD